MDKVLVFTLECGVIVRIMIHSYRNASIRWSWCLGINVWKKIWSFQKLVLNWVWCLSACQGKQIIVPGQVKGDWWCRRSLRQLRPRMRLRLRAPEAVELWTLPRTGKLSDPTLSDPFLVLYTINKYVTRVSTTHFYQLSKMLNTVVKNGAVSSCMKLLSNRY